MTSSHPDIAGARPDAASPEKEPRELLREAVQCHQRGDLEQAETLYRRVLQSDPRQPDAVHFLGLIAHQTGFHREALELMEQALELNPASALFYYNLGKVLYQQRRYDEAIARLRRAIELRGDYVDAQLELADIYETLGDKAAAARCCAQVAADHPRSAGIQQRVGLKFFEAGDIDAATAHVRQALELNPRFIDGYNTLGVMDGDMGRFESAAADFRKAIAIDPRNCRAYFNLKTVLRFASDSPELAAMEALHDDIGSLPRDDAIMLEFSLGKAYDDTCEADRAMRHYFNGNRLKRESIPYSRDTQAEFFEAMARVFDRDGFEAHAAAGNDSRLPIFVLGMSRSGTTLIEQITASHPDVHGGGELPALHRAVKRVVGPETEDRDLPEQLHALDNPEFEALGADYLERVKTLAPTHAHITDKLPGNVVMIGLIHRLFPRAPMILCRRHPAAVCLSCFKKLFAGSHHFTYDLAEMGDFYLMYQKLMDHWKAVLPPDRMLEVRYEDVVEDVEGEARRIIDYCGLGWNDAVLNFHETRREVRTASMYQVRQPIYRGSVAGWRRHEQNLEPLLDILAPLIERYETETTGARHG